MKLFFFFFLFFNIFLVNANAKVVYLDMNLLLSKSDVGIFLNNHLKKIADTNMMKYQNIENKIIKEEKNLLSQQNILEKSEFDKKLNELSNEVKIYRSNKKKSLDDLNEIKLKNIKKILDSLNPIISNYVNENSISLVVPRKNIIVGKKDLDITDKIIKLMNIKIQKLDF